MNDDIDHILHFGSIFRGRIDPEGFLSRGRIVYLSLAYYETGLVWSCALSFSDRSSIVMTGDMRNGEVAFSSVNCCVSGKIIKLPCTGGSTAFRAFGDSVGSVDALADKMCPAGLKTASADAVQFDSVRLRRLLDRALFYNVAFGSEKAVSRDAFRSYVLRYTYGVDGRIQVSVEGVCELECGDVAVSVSVCGDGLHGRRVCLNVNWPDGGRVECDCRDAGNVPSVERAWWLYCRMNDSRALPSQKRKKLKLHAPVPEREREDSSVTVSH